MFDFLKPKVIPQNQEQLFESQLSVLKKCRLADIAEIFSRNKKLILAHASSLIMTEGYLPFLPVVSLDQLNYYELMELIQYKDRSGRVCCEADRITDLEKVPVGLYYIFDVEEGAEWQSRAPEVARTLICQNGRLPTTAVEIINLALQTDVLARRSLDATGSRYGSDRTPMVWLNVVISEASRGWKRSISEKEFGISLLKKELGKPGLGWWYSSSPSLGGAPSCASRLAVE